MLKTNQLLFTLFMVLPMLTMAQKGTISEDERRFLTDYLTLTQANLIQTLQQIDDKAWTYRPADGGWTVEECMHHILLAEKAVFNQVKAAMQAEAEPGVSTREKDAWLLSKIADRGVKVKTPLPMQLEGSTKAQMAAGLKKSRTEILDYLQQKDLALRAHFGRSPYGKADAYQLMLVIAGHSMRHHNQMLEVLADMENN